jgi:hypothetical protein
VNADTTAVTSLSGGVGLPGPLMFQTTETGGFDPWSPLRLLVGLVVVATGYPPVDWPPNGGLGPVIPPNVQLRMVLTADWKSGSANCKYSAGDGTWRSVSDAPVRAVPCTSVG